MKYFRIHAALASDTREFSINENQTAEFAAGNIDDDPANMDGRDTIHLMDKNVALSPAEYNYRSPITRNIFPLHN